MKVSSLTNDSKLTFLIHGETIVSRDVVSAGLKYIILHWFHLPVLCLPKRIKANTLDGKL